MSKSAAPSYLKSAIERIYGNDDDFIVIGLTGRTGSGCSTVAKILQSERDGIKHSLYTGRTPPTSEARKERIVHAFFRADWKPFLLIQVRSVITTFLLEKPPGDAVAFLSDIVLEDQRHDVEAVLEDIRALNEKVVRGLESAALFLHAAAQ